MDNALHISSGFDPLFGSVNKIAKAKLNAIVVGLIACGIHVNQVNKFQWTPNNI